MMGFWILLNRLMRFLFETVYHYTLPDADCVVRTTGTANLDSRLLVTASDLAKQKARNMKLGDAAFNVDEYVAKLVALMGGRHLVGQDDRDREDSMDWAELGRLSMGICRRPPTIGFMLGPLSVEKKERKVTRRQVERRDDTQVVRPQEVPSPPPLLLFENSGIDECS
jgi:hypothetical protein